MHIMQIAMQIHCRSTRKLSAVGTMEFFTVLTTFHSDLCKELHYEGAIFIQNLYSVLKKFTTEGSYNLNQS
jgi:hypothetical protein